MDDSQPRRHDEYRYSQPYGPPAPPKSSELNTQAGIQIALTVLALAALPISAWLYISSYVEERVDVAIERHDKALQQTITRQAESIEDLRDYAFKLCVGVRKVDPTFSCGSTYFRDRIRD